MYQLNQFCTLATSRILVKEKNSKFFTYKTVKNIYKLLESGTELFSLDDNMLLNKITHVENVSLQEEFIEIRTFSGSRLIIGTDVHIFVDSVWLYLNELEFHEKIWEYNFLKDFFHPTYITHIQPYIKKTIGYRVYAENDSGIVMNNLIVRFQGIIERVEDILSDELQNIILTDEFGD